MLPDSLPELFIIQLAAAAVVVEKQNNYWVSLNAKTWKVLTQRDYAQSHLKMQILHTSNSSFPQKPNQTKPKEVTKAIY